jgi:hypothetical protein
LPAAEVQDILDLIATLKYYLQIQFICVTKYQKGSSSHDPQKSAQKQRTLAEDCF